jgi:transcriptional regulator with XRE-family HTH domain
MDSAPQKRRGDPVVGARIRTLRKERGLTLRQLSSAAKVDFHNLSKLENGHVGYSPESIRRIADALQVPVSEIFMETSSAKPGNAVFWIPWVDDPSKPALPVDHDYGEHAMALRMPDDSMSPEIPEGATVITAPPHLFRPGRLYGVRLVDGEKVISTTVRRIKELRRFPDDIKELKDGSSSISLRRQFEVVPVSAFYKSEDVLESQLLGEVVEIKYKLYR